MSALPDNMPHVIDHQISLYYFLPRCRNIFDYKYSDLKTLGLPERITEAFNSDYYKNKEIWEAGSIAVSKDFAANIHQLFDPGVKQPVIQCFKLSKIALKSINGQQLHYPKETPDDARIAAFLCLPFKQSAIERLQEQGVPQKTAHICLDEIEFYAFKTGFNIAVIHCHIKTPDFPHPTLIAETVYSLSRFNSLHWQEPPIYPACAGKIRLGELLHNLVGDADGYKKERRVYSNTYVQFQGDVNAEDLKINLLKLARHYNDDYQISNSSSTSQFCQDFDNIVHCLSPEGAATAVVLDASSPHFLKDYKNKVRKLVIRPMQLLTFHENNAIQNYLCQTSIWLTDQIPDSRLLDILRQHQLAIQNFTLNFQHPVISGISIHNHLYNSLRQIQNLDKLLDKAKQDNETIRQLITTYHEQKNSLRYCRLSKYGIAAVAFLTVFTISKEVLEVLVKQNWMLTCFPDAAEFLHHWAGMIHLGLALTTMIAVFFIERRHCGNDSAMHPHGPTSHLWKELLKHRMLNHEQ